MKDKKILRLTELAILIAITLVMSLTPIGYLNYGPIAITFLMIPVAVGGINLGIGASTALGLVFGLTSMLQAFGFNATGTLMMEINPFGTIIVLVGARVLAGFLCGLVYKGMDKICRITALNMAVTSFSASAFNTIFYLGFLLLFFANDPTIGQSILALLTLVLLLNAVVEAIACTVVGTAVGVALKKAIRR